MPKRHTTREFIDISNAKHGNKYDYGKAKYVMNKEKIIIICPIHGEFEQYPCDHMKGRGCRKCGSERMSYSHLENLDIFISKARIIHGDKYDYSKFVYTKSNQKSIITCFKHGDFQQSPNSHLCNRGCKKCGQEKVAELQSGSFSEFISLAIKIHGNKYDYSKSEASFVNLTEKVCIVCPAHGEFMQLPFLHMKGRGCTRCAKIKMGNEFRKSKEEFVIEARIIHGGRYNYSQVGYESAHTPITIICPKHGAFNQSPSKHLRGAGCHKCNFSHGERMIAKCLEYDNISYSTQDRIFSNHRLAADFIIKHGKEKIVLEFHGAHHYMPYDFRSKKQDDNNLEGFICTIKRDSEKECDAAIKKMKFFVMPFWDKDRIKEIIKAMLQGQSTTTSPPKFIHKYLLQKRKLCEQMKVKEPIISGFLPL